MKCYFLTNQENIFFCFLVNVPFNFHFFQFLQFWKKNFCGTLARATSLYIRKTFRGLQKKGSRATSGPRNPDMGHLTDMGDLGLLPSPIPLLPQSSQVTDVFWCQRCREKCATDFHLITSGEQAWSPRPGHWFQNWLHDVCDHRSSVELAQWWDESVPLTEPLLLSPPQAHHRFQYLWNF